MRTTFSVKEESFPWTILHKLLFPKPIQKPAFQNTGNMHATRIGGNPQ